MSAIERFHCILVLHHNYKEIIFYISSLLLWQQKLVRKWCQPFENTTFLSSKFEIFSKINNQGVLNKVRVGGKNIRKSVSVPPCIWVPRVFIAPSSICRCQKICKRFLVEFRVDLRIRSTINSLSFNLQVSPKQRLDSHLSNCKDFLILPWCSSGLKSSVDIGDGSLEKI